MTARLLASRDAIAAALTAGGVRVATTAKFSAPCAILEPGDPWAAVDLSLGRKRTGRWRLTLVAGQADSAGAHDTLAELVDLADAALLALPGVELPTWAMPFDRTLAGIPYAATVATIQYMTAQLEEV